MPQAINVQGRINIQAFVKKTRLFVSYQRRFSKVNNHEGNCNEVVKPQTKFWLKSPILEKKKLLTDIVVLEVKRARLDNENEAAKQQLTASGNAINFLEEKNSELNCQLEEMNNVYRKLKFITNLTAHGKTMREKI